MKRKEGVGLLSLLLLTIVLFGFSSSQSSINDQILAYTVDTKNQNLQFFWKNDSGEILGSIQNLKTYVES